MLVDSTKPAAASDGLSNADRRGVTTYYYRRKLGLQGVLCSKSYRMGPTAACLYELELCVSLLRSAAACSAEPQRGPQELKKPPPLFSRRMSQKKKIKKAFFCQSCGAESPKWQGRCDSCGEWNTFVEELIDTSAEAAVGFAQKATSSSRPQLIHEIDSSEHKRLRTQFSEFNSVLGGGMVPGAVMLLAGDPGIGKSTLLLQVALAATQQKVLYVSGEESAQQIKMRAERLGPMSPSCYVVGETCLQHILQHLEQLRPDFLIIDSIQTLHSLSIDAAPGSIAQIRLCTLGLSNYAKGASVPMFLVGHVNKDGAVAGPKALEHMVDVVLQFEGEKQQLYRMLRSVKNRFGSTSTLALYQMNEKGLQEVRNPSEALLSDLQHHHSGVAIGMLVEGTRPLLLEVQSLVSRATYSNVQRIAMGIDIKRLHILLALLEKRKGMLFGGQDVFVNLAGGIKIEDRALDLALCVALSSSLKEKPVPQKSGFAAEVGLGGELRPVQRIDARIQEAQQLGLKDIYLSCIS